MSERYIPHKVPEVILKKKKKNEISKAKSVANEIKNKTKKESILKRIRFKRAEKFVKEYRSRENFDIQIQRRARRANLYKIPVDPTLIFVVRIKTPLDLHLRARKVLNLLRLITPNTGVFLKLNTTTLKLLRLIEPYITWGTPNLKSIRELIYKRGHAKTKNGFKSLNDNRLIEDHLGQYDIICIEDIIHEIVTLGPHFKEVNALIWHIKMNLPTESWKNSGLPFNKEGQYGDRKDKINSLLAQMV
ncbi:hypothetical protein HELRODRAFT_116952 [Helobdella robusta]|uniref:Ribosomal protein L30 ferredoxin-like fold domain-containing protein n=1 Tax=Helobdella robusta TaxID=6412 RepID=T1EGI7_HELRO|nr:hypothetical protein HELRODRAFT_116952 [Helobdella robusta]ESO10519.1 hypothetical protein HELRODRAFT_116952 [Helobdella robusta]